MANLPESNQWENGIYQLETTDPVEGGPNGIDNQQAKQLANRTAYLKAQVETLGTGKQPLDATLTALAALAIVADRLIYSTGADTFALTPLTAFIRTLLDDADAAAARATLGAAASDNAALTGTPTAPTAAPGTNTTQLANTAFVQAAVAAIAAVNAATEAAAGKVELATDAETITGTDNVRATHPAGVKAAINAAAANKAIINALNAWTKAQAPATAALADGSVINWDCSNIQVATVTIYGNRTMAAPSAVQPGALYLLRVTQDPTGSRLLAWDSAFKFGSAGAPTLTTTAGKTDFLSFIGGAGNTLEFLGYRLNGV